MSVLAILKNSKLSFKKAINLDFVINKRPLMVFWYALREKMPLFLRS